MDQSTSRNKNSSNRQDPQNVGINQPMLLFEDPPQASRNKARVQASLKPEDYTINLKSPKAIPCEWKLPSDYGKIEDKCHMFRLW